MTKIIVSGGRAGPSQVGMPGRTGRWFEAVTMRLRATKRFERVEVLKRFASITRPPHRSSS